MNGMEFEDKIRHESGRLIEKWFQQPDVEDQNGRKNVYHFPAGSIHELFHSFDFQVIFPELNAIHSAVRHHTTDMIHVGEALGYASDICGYVLSDLGLMAGPLRGVAPFGTVPPPDLLVLNHTGCITYIKWFEALARHFDVPLVILDVPFVRGKEPTAYDREYVRGQIGELIDVCENISGKKFDSDRLSGILRKSREAIDLWHELLDLGKLIPTPFDGYFEATSYMAPIAIMRGTQEAVDYYSELIHNIKSSADALAYRSGAQKYRLVFDGAPPWPWMKVFREMFSDHGAVGVAGTYSRVVCDYEAMQGDPDKPMDFLVALSNGSYYNWNLGKRREFIYSLVRDFSADGIVHHSVRSCRPYSLGMLDTRNFFARETEYPVLFVDSDVADPRFFSKAQIKDRVDSFIDTLENCKIRKEK